MILPMLPLPTVFYPGDTVPLHIFEDRYIQLVHDCRDEAVTFGIPVYTDNTVVYGTEVQLVEIVNTYEGGVMDITCVARQVFKVVTFDPHMEGKLYAGGQVEFLDNVDDGTEAVKKEVLNGLKELYRIMELSFTPIPLKKFNSYVLAHKMGLSFQQEYDLLQLAKESERLSFINNHLIITIGVFQGVDRTKKSIKINGDFKNFDPLDFEGFHIE